MCGYMDYCAPLLSVVNSVQFFIFIQFPPKKNRTIYFKFNRLASNDWRTTSSDSLKKTGRLYLLIFFALENDLKRRFFNILL